MWIGLATAKLLVLVIKTLRWIVKEIGVLDCERGNKIIRGLLFSVVIIQVYCYQLCNHAVFISKHTMFRAVGFHILFVILRFLPPFFAS